MKEKGINEKSLAQMKNKYFSAQKPVLADSKSVRCRVMIGAVLFNIRDSEGYLAYPWWKTLFVDDMDSFYISTLGVINEFRNRGIAQQLLERVMKLTEGDPKIKLIYLHVIDYNIAARKLYEKIGFELLAQFKNYYKIDNKNF